MDFTALRPWLSPSRFSEAVAAQGIGRAILQVRRDLGIVSGDEHERSMAGLHTLEQGFTRVSDDFRDRLTQLTDYGIAHLPDFPLLSPAHQRCLTDGIILAHLGQKIGIRFSFLLHTSHFNILEETTGMAVELRAKSGTLSSLQSWQQRGMLGAHQQPAGPEAALAAFLYRVALDHMGTDRKVSDDLAAAALEVFPDYPATWVHRYELVPDDRTTCLDKALALHPDFARALVYRGLRSMKTKQWDKARHALERALEVAPEQQRLKAAYYHPIAVSPVLDPDLEFQARFNLAITVSQQGDGQRAIQLLQDQLTHPALTETTQAAIQSALTQLGASRD